MLANILERIGIGNHTTIIAYDDQGGAMASRLRWLLQWLGHDGQVYLIEGGFAGWQEAGYPVSTDVPSLIEGINFNVNVRDEMLVSQADVKARVGKVGTVVIDSREAPRYRGEVEPLDPKAGHIPGAINRFWNESKRADGSWKSPEEQSFASTDCHKMMRLSCIAAQA